MVIKVPSVVGDKYATRIVVKGGSCMEKIIGVLFDLDGVLVDATEWHY